MYLLDQKLQIVYLRVRDRVRNREFTLGTYDQLKAPGQPMRVYSAR